MSDIITTPPVSLLNIIERASRDPSVDVGKLAALLEMQERVMRTRAKQAFTEALSAVAGELEPVARDARNPHLGTRYAKLETIDEAVRPIYSRHGFSVRFGSEPTPDGRVHVTCTLSHVGGHSETLGLSAPIDAVGTGGKQSKTGVQAIGSTVTYLRRYLLTMALNITLVDDDDDGEATRRIASAPAPVQTAPHKSLSKFDAWMLALETDLAQAQSRLGVDAIAERSDVKRVLAAAGEGAVQSERAARVVDAFTAAYGRADLAHIIGDEGTGDVDPAITAGDRWRA
jgi:hypothetical protein